LLPQTKQYVAPTAVAAPDKQQQRNETIILFRRQEKEEAPPALFKKRYIFCTCFLKMFVPGSLWLSSMINKHAENVSLPPTSAPIAPSEASAGGASRGGGGFAAPAAAATTAADDDAGDALAATDVEENDSPSVSFSSLESSILTS